MAPKAPDAFRTISEVADWLGVSTHVLRFWESKFPQIKPVKRAGGRRYYRPADMELLGGLRKLLHDDGLTVKGAQKILKEQGVKAVSALSPPIEIAPSRPAAVSRARAKKSAEPLASVAQATADREDGAKPETSRPETVAASQEAAPEAEASPADASSTQATPESEVAPEVAAQPEREAEREVEAQPDAQDHPVEDVQPEDAAPEAGSETQSVIPPDARGRGATGSPIFSAPPASLTDPADTAPQASDEALPLFSRRRLPESLPGAESAQVEVTEPSSADAPDQGPPDTRQPEAGTAPAGVPEANSDREAALSDPLRSQPGDLRIAPLPGPDLSLAERLERLVPGQIPADRLRPIHSRLRALRDRMETDRFTG